MAKKKKTNNPNQMTIFDLVRRSEVQRERIDTDAGSMDIEKRFRAAIKEAIENCPKGIGQIGDEMSKLLGCKVTENMLNNWKPDSKTQYRFPVIYLAAFCKVTGSTYPIRIIARSAGLFVMESPDAVRTERDQINEKIKNLQAKKREYNVLIKKLEGR